MLVPPALAKLMVSIVAPPTSGVFGRYQGDDRAVELSAMSSASAVATQRLYSVMTSFEQELRESSDGLNAFEAARAAAQKFDLMGAIELGRSLGRDAGNASERVRQTLHDLRGGALGGLLGEVELTRVGPRPGSLRALQVLAATHLKIMRNAVLGLDDARREADQRVVPHSIERLEESLANVGGSVDSSVHVTVHRTFHGDVTASCIELGALDRACLNLVNNAVRYASDGRVHVALASSTGAVGGDLRIVVANAITQEAAERLTSHFRPGRLSRIFVDPFTTSGSGEGFKICADFTAAAYGLPRREDAVDSGIIGASIEEGWFLAWMHWPAIS